MFEHVRTTGFAIYTVELGIAISWTALHGGVCTLSGWSPLYVVESSSDAEAVYYTRELARNDSAIPSSNVDLLVRVPTSGVFLGDG